MARMIGRMVPATTLLLAVLAAALPLGSTLAASLALVFVSLAVVCQWSVLQPQLMPPWLAFLAGLLIDTAGDGPLGFWALLFLTGQAMAVAAHRLLPEEGALRSWGLFAVLAGIVTGAGWGIASLYHLQWLDWRPVWFAAVFATLSHPILRGLLLLLADKAVAGADDRRPRRHT